MGLLPGWGQLKFGVAVGEWVAVTVGVRVGGMGVDVVGSGVGVGVRVGGTAVSVGIGVAVGSWETAVSAPALQPIKPISRQKMSSATLFFILILETQAAELGKLYCFFAAKFTCLRIGCH